MCLISLARMSKCLCFIQLREYLISYVVNKMIKVENRNYLVFCILKVNESFKTIALISYLNRFIQIRDNKEFYGIRRDP